MLIDEICESLIKWQPSVLFAYVENNTIYAGIKQGQLISHFENMVKAYGFNAIIYNTFDVNYLPEVEKQTVINRFKELNGIISVNLYQDRFEIEYHGSEVSLKDLKTKALPRKVILKINKSFADKRFKWIDTGGIIDITYGKSLIDIYYDNATFTGDVLALRNDFAEFNVPINFIGTFISSSENKIELNDVVDKFKDKYSSLQWVRSISYEEGCFNVIIQDTPRFITLLDMRSYVHPLKVKFIDVHRNKEAYGEDLVKVFKEITLKCANYSAIKKINMPYWSSFKNLIFISTNLNGNEKYFKKTVCEIRELASPYRVTFSNKHGDIAFCEEDLLRLSLVKRMVNLLKFSTIKKLI